MQMREDATSQDDLATICDSVDHGEAGATVDVSDEAMLPGWQDVDAEPALDATGRPVPGLISLEPFLEDALEAHRWQRQLRHGHRVSPCLHEIVCFAPSVMSLLDAHRGVDTKRHTALGHPAVLHTVEVRPG